MPAPPASVAAESTDAQVLLPELKGLWLLGSAASVVHDGVTQTGVTIRGLPLIDSWSTRAVLGVFLGRPLTRGSLKQIQLAIVNLYRARHHPFMTVLFPEQDIGTGVLQVVVTEFRAGRIAVAGNNWFTARRIREAVRLRSGQTIDSARLDADIAWLNENPFRQVNVIAQRSDTVGATDLTLQTADRLPFRFEAGFDTDGVPSLGRERWRAGFTWGNAFWMDQQLTYSFLSSDDFWFRPTHVPVAPGGATLAAHSLTDVIPLPWRDRILVFGVYDQARPVTGSTFFTQTGIDWQTGIRYVAPIAIAGWPQQEIQFGFDFKRTNNNLEFGGTQVSNSLTDVAQLVLSYGMSALDDWGQTALTNRAVYSPGGLTANDTDAAYQPSNTHVGVSFAKARYVYDDLVVNRATRLPYDFAWTAKLEGQIASTNLLSSERLAAGGEDSVRGYDPYAATGSLGVLSSQELRLPAWAPLKHLTRGHVQDQLQILGFWDWAWVKDARLISGAPRQTTISSAGAGLRYAVGRYLDVKLDYGWQLQALPGATRRGSLLELSVVVGN